MKFIPINKPILGEREKKAVLSVLDSGALTDSSLEGGKAVRELEGKVRRLLKVKHVVAMNSGTAALHSSMLALRIRPGDEVIVPSFTFVATASVVLACGGRPVFVDNKPDYNMDPRAVRKAITRRTKAIVPVHLYGYPADMDEINEVARSHSVAVVEDAAESLGAEYRGRQTGSLSTAGCFSFYATKVVTSGEGGAVSTDDDGFAYKLRQVRNHGMIRGYDSRHLGFNYRMTEVSAAIGSVQMDRLQSFLATRRRNATHLRDRLSEMDGVAFTQTGEDRRHAFYLYTLSLARGRDKVVERLNRRGIGAAVYFRTPVHRTHLHASGRRAGELRGADEASRRVVSLPVHPGVTPREVERIADEFIAAAARYG